MTPTFSRFYQIPKSNMRGTDPELRNALDFYLFGADRAVRFSSGERTRPRVLAMSPWPSRSSAFEEHCGEAPQWAREARALPEVNRAVRDGALLRVEVEDSLCANCMLGFVISDF